MRATATIDASNLQRKLAELIADIGDGARSIHDYIAPGLTSRLLGELGRPGIDGRLRVFEASRTQNVTIAPHSHRFNFAQCVLRGWIRNTIWVPSEQVPTDVDVARDEFAIYIQHYQGAPGQYTRSHERSNVRFSPF